MSAPTITDPNLPPALPTPNQDDDPYRIGWRDIARERPDGAVERVRIPLTASDALHPRFGDVILENTLHAWIVNYLYSVFQSQSACDPGAMVTQDVGVYWDDRELGHHSPDVAVIFDVRDPKKTRKSFSVAKEKTRPRLIVEVVSPDTRDNDVVTKVQHYHRARVELYVIVDRVGDQWKLIGYQYTPSKYVPLPLDELGRLWLEPVNVSLAIKDDRVACYDVGGNEIGDYVVERARAEAEKARADAAEQRLRELEAQLGRTTPPE